MASKQASEQSVVHPTLSQVIQAMEALWPVSLQQNWDASGIVAGRPEQKIQRIHWAVDPVQAVADEAVASGADLVVTHHPLFLRPVTSIAATTFKGKVLHTLVENSCALITAHTNADSAVGGVSDVLAEILGLENLEPLAAAEDGLHEEGIGRVGTLPAGMRLEEFATRVYGALPAVAGGVRVAGDPNGIVSKVAITGGAGDSLFDHVRQHEADVYITADLRHHPASEAREQAMAEADRPYLIDVSHFASEWLWLPAGANALERALADEGFTITSAVSAINTDPWDFILTSGDETKKIDNETE
ncbi:MAG: Nif3-like dinuclear metal center hexameric protein [Yaniella sp.]|uniref:Nif3-like dinuclear metal center hexameric protein n=3 Tax=Yaniella sp. TaxID=2773929 RepID=UPI002647AAAB|nr:Nif3-like dinuclear metal center hexameric protein [Yaniella sp.]MDN5732049.1 Nif3-like dinuclear metal center hexameric protein [Yaniella sp.]MDN5743102.1 Nif3-like dinuclear metal center hexameric protein [Yaniella sp.]MDN5818585.1 Nif3-like dinuclear metal center hexameric protein [Yaniella sp.]MDN5838890.1 Nif3-like dinuclear metal center hexameric protein [Yaniella sp.]MDN5890176.1 Nif3-like dinuclear metal center hexameric protein [Yaniella sp.]